MTVPPENVVDQAIENLSVAQAVLQGLISTLVGCLLAVQVFRYLGRSFQPPTVVGPHPRGFLAAGAFLVFAAGVVLFSRTLPSFLPADSPPPAEIESESPRVEPVDSSDPEAAAAAPLDLKRAFLINLGAGVLAIAYLLLALRTDRAPLSAVGLSWSGFAASLRLASAGFVAALFLQMGAMLLQSSYFELLGRDPPTQLAVRTLNENPGLLTSPLFLFAVVLGIPLIEEVLWRGLLLTVLLRHLKPAVAIVISALLFALMHDGGQLPVLVQGILLACLYQRTRTLTAPLLFHALHNLLTVLIIHFGSSAT